MKISALCLMEILCPVVFHFQYIGFVCFQDMEAMKLSKHQMKKKKNQWSKNSKSPVLINGNKDGLDGSTMNWLCLQGFPL